MRGFRAAAVCLFVMGCGADAAPPASPDSPIVDSALPVDSPPSVDHLNIDSPLTDAPAIDAPIVDAESDAGPDGSPDAFICVCVTPGPCEIGPGTCNAAGQCVYTKKTAGTVCRAAAGPCDLAEVCNGTSGACPNDSKVTAGTVCHAATGPCDLAETCDGTNAACPNDQVAASGTVCR